MNVTVEKTPIRLRCPQQLITVTSIAKRPGQHVGAAIRTDHIKSFLQQSDGVKTSSGGYIQHRTSTVLLEQTDKEVTLRFSPCIPVDQSIPAISEVFDVLLLVVIRLANRFRRLSKTLLIVLRLQWMVLR